MRFSSVIAFVGTLTCGVEVLLELSDLGIFGLACLAKLFRLLLFVRRGLDIFLEGMVLLPQLSDFGV